jgi:predicted RNase H-like HicB family nuclease
MMERSRTRSRVVSELIEIRALVHEEDGSYWAEVPACPGLFASGDTLDELVEALHETWVIYHDGEPTLESEDLGPTEWADGTSSLTLRVPAFA